jgi:hypothetical protein
MSDSAHVFVLAVLEGSAGGESPQAAAARGEGDGPDGPTCCTQAERHAHISIPD